MTLETIMGRLGYIRRKDAEATIKALRNMNENDSNLAAALVEECQRLQEEIDNLSEENEMLTKGMDEMKTRLEAMRTSNTANCEAAQKAGDKIWCLLAAMQNVSKGLDTVSARIRDVLADEGFEPPEDD